jgi:hypothetical protein
MRTMCKIATLTLTMLAITAYGFSQKPAKQTPATTTQNLVRGVLAPFGGNGDWANFSLLNEIPGSALYPLSSPTAVFYWGFVGGTAADISNMVLYTTSHASLTITAVTPVTFGGISNPSINLTNTSICPTQPLSTTNPCVVKFDPVSITLSPASDYYLTVFFTNDTNNQSLSAIQPSGLPGSLSSTFVGGTDETHLKVGQSLPNGTNGRPPYFLMFVMSN